MPIISIYGVSHLHFYVSGAAARERDVGVSTLTGGQEGETCSVVSPHSNTVHAGSPRVLYCNGIQTFFCERNSLFVL